MVGGSATTAQWKRMACTAGFFGGVFHLRSARHAHRHLREKDEHAVSHDDVSSHEK
jgi:hypothetical protein